MMNICMFGASFLPRRGGMEYVIHNLANALVAQGHTVTVLAARVSWAPFNETHDYRLVRYGLPVRGFGNLGINHLCAILAFIGLHVRKRFDILHCHSSSYAGSRAKNIKRLFKSLPLVMTPHGEDIQRVPEISYGMRLNDRWDKKIRNNLLSADIVTAISLSVEKELDFIALNRIRRIPNGVDTKSYTTCKSDYLRKILDIEESTVIVLSVGRNHVKKGYADGIKAVTLLVHKHGIRNIHYVIVGRGVSEHESLVKRSEMKKYVSLIEELPPEDVRRCYASADVFFSPSVIEGLSLVSIEAVASGLPVVVTDVPGNIDIVNDTNAGLIAKAGDIDDMASQLLKFMDTGVRKTYSEKASARSIIYDWSAIARKYTGVYEELAARTNLT